MGEGTTGLRIASIVDKANPSVVGSVALGGGDADDISITQDENYLCIANGIGVAIIDITVKANP